MKATIYHNPMCGTSRKTLEILNNEGADVTVIEYLKAPPSREELKRLYERAGITPRPSTIELMPEHAPCVELYVSVCGGVAFASAMAMSRTSGFCALPPMP